MNVGLLTTSYKTTELEIREKLAISEGDVKPLISFVKGRSGINELMVLSTCNRVELYLQSDDLDRKMDEVEKSLLEYLQIGEELKFQFQRLKGTEAIAHIFRVTSSLEAMVIGEPQISGQVKNYFHLSVESGGCGFFLNQIMNRAFITAKRVRSETEIAKFAVSISFAAVELAKKIFDSLENKSILVVGAGEMAELAVNHLLKAGCSHLMVANRTFSRAVSLAEKFSGSAVRFEYMANHLESADIVISSTGAKGYVIEPAIMSKCMRKRKHRPMFLIDIAVPRDIDPKINDLANAFVYDIDDLQTVVDNNLKFRENEAKKAEIIIANELEKIEEWLITLDVIPTIKMFRERVLEMAGLELQKGLGQLGEISSKQERTVRSMINSLAYKILHQPTVMLKQKAKEGTVGLEYVQVINDLFDLSPKTEKKTPRKIINLK